MAEDLNVEVPAWLEPYIELLMSPDFEGFVSTMYRDTAGHPKVTVGVGFNLTDMVHDVNDQSDVSPSEKWEDWPFFHILKDGAGQAVVRDGQFVADETKPATSSQVVAEYERVNAMPPNPKTGKSYRAEHYRNPSGYVGAGGWAGVLALTKEWCGMRVRQDLLVRIANLTKIFPRFADFPVDAKLAIIDLHYNGGLKHSLIKAIRDVNSIGWFEVSRLSNRSNVDAYRNYWTRMSFERAGGHSDLPWFSDADIHLHRHAFDVPQRKASGHPPKNEHRKSTK